MPKTNTKTKGHRFDKLRYHIPYYTTPFFKPDGELEDGEIAKSATVIKLPVKIHTDGGDSRSNITSVEMMGITHFDNNVENVLESLWQLNERVIKPKDVDDADEKIKLQWKMMELICSNGTASQTLQEACKTGRQHVYDEHLKEYVDGDDEIQEEILVQDETVFFDYLERDFDDLDTAVHATSAAFTAFLYKEFDRAAWNYLHSIIFGADTYRAFKQQKDYMTHKIIKPFGVSVEAAFRRVEIMCTLLKYFPPPSSRGKTATAAQWASFENKKRISNDDKREMKYNLLPDSFHDDFDDAPEDWTSMSNTKFLAEAQKFEAKDAKDRLKTSKAREVLKRKKKEDADSISTLSRPQASKNNKNKKVRYSKEATSAGKARMCELCKLAGAPSFVYNTHWTKDCRKKDEYEKSLSGGAGSRKKAVKEYRASEKQLRRELKMLTRINKLKKANRSQKKSKRTDNSDDDMSSVSSAEEDTNVSY